MSCVAQLATHTHTNYFFFFCMKKKKKNMDEAVANPILSKKDLSLVANWRIRSISKLTLIRQFLGRSRCDRFLKWQFDDIFPTKNLILVIANADFQQYCHNGVQSGRCRCDAVYRIRFIWLTYSEVSVRYQ